MPSSPHTGRQLLGVHIVAEGGQQPHIQPQQAHVVGDVPAHAARAHPHPAGVGVLVPPVPHAGQPPMSMFTPPTTVT